MSGELEAFLADEGNVAALLGEWFPDVVAELAEVESARRMPVVGAPPSDRRHREAETEHKAGAAVVAPPAGRKRRVF